MSLKHDTTDSEQPKKTELKLLAEDNKGKTIQRDAQSLLNFFEGEP